jgi:uncharacterized membrane protein YqjE
METSTPASPGFLSSIRDLADSLLSSVHDRIELVSVELQEEKYRLIQIFIWISAAIFTGMMAITFASITIVYLFWENARIAALSGLTALYTVALGAIVFGFRRYLARQPRPFSGTLQEMKLDRACIRTES